MSVFPKNKLKCGLVWPENYFPLSFCPSQMTSGPENSAVFVCKINKCLPLCIIQFQVAFLDAAADCVEWQWFSKILPSPCGYVHHGSMTVSQTIAPEGSCSCSFSSGFSPWLLRTEIMIIICNLALRNVIQLTDNSLTKFGTKWWTMTHPCLQQLSLWWMLLLYSVNLPEQCYL